LAVRPDSIRVTGSKAPNGVAGRTGNGGRGAGGGGLREHEPTLVGFVAVAQDDADRLHRSGRDSG